MSHTVVARFGKSSRAAVAGLLVLALASWTVLAPSQQGLISPIHQGLRSLTVLDAMQRNFYVPVTGTYLGQLPPSLRHPDAYLWPYSQAVYAMLEVALIHDVGARPDLRDLVAHGLQGLTYYANGPGYDSSISDPSHHGTYYDDDAWTDLDFLTAYDLTKSEVWLNKASDLFAFLETGIAKTGGVYWNTDRTRRTISSTAPTIEAALRLYAITEQPHYLEIAMELYNWVQAHLMLKSGLYADHVRTNGTVDRSIWSYNQGAMIGAGVLMYQSTGNKIYLKRAERTASAMAKLWSGSEARALHNPTVFNAIYFRGLLRLAEVDPAAADWRKQAQNYANAAWQRLRNSNNDLFGITSGRGPYLLENQAGMVQIYAMLSRIGYLLLNLPSGNVHGRSKKHG